ncbi:NAD(P)H-dependent glycerol-3-phosphate dehydrogenase [Fimbriimonas ginsengisoli]|nr:NAD(P)H-dependent glycerol-3-phosphate dehydrogenase [Fimbriimonas ginsengisoli]
MHVAVLGSGSWGTALTILLARNGHCVTLLGRNEEEIRDLRETRENHRYLSGFTIPENATFSMLGQDALDVEMTVVAVPSGAVRDIVSRIRGNHPLVVVAAKGLEAHSSKLMTEVVAEALPGAETGVLSGPNLAVEIAKGIPTVAVAAYRSREAAERVRDAFNCPSFRVSVSDDVVGVELAGALKNVLAIGGGMSDGLGFGDNTKGAFLSRGLMEMARIGSAMGARAETFLGPAGVGDLFATAVSRLSRNYRLGRALGEGRTLEQALAELGQVAEGVPTSEAVGQLARIHGVDLPVFMAVEAVLKGLVSPQKAVALLMERTVKMDDFIG